jgi:hypothetical protein
MLDLRLLNAEINASTNHNIPRKNPGNESGKSSLAKGSSNAPIEIFTFKQTPQKRTYNTLNSKTLWNADPLNRKYGLEM